MLSFSVCGCIVARRFCSIYLCICDTQNTYARGATLTTATTHTLDLQTHARRLRVSRADCLRQPPTPVNIQKCCRCQHHYNDADHADETDIRTHPINDDAIGTGDNAKFAINATVGGGAYIMLVPVAIAPKYMTRSRRVTPRI